MSVNPTSPSHAISRQSNSPVVNQVWQSMAGNGSCTVAQFTELLNTFTIDKDMHVAQGVPLLHFVAGHGRKELVYELLKRKPLLNPAGGGLTPLHFAVSKDRNQCSDGEDERRAEIIRYLVQAGVDVNAQEERGWTALKFAVRFRLLACVQELLSLRANPDLADTEGFACLHNATGSVELTQILLPYVSSADAVNRRGQTALIVSLVQSDFPTAALLIDNGADTNVVDCDGNMPLTLATRLGNHQLCKHLVSKGAKVNAVSPMTGRQAVHYAAEGGMENLAVWLTQEGGNVFAKDMSGYSALQLANAQLGHLLRIAAAPSVVAGGRVDELREIISSGVSVNATAGVAMAPLLHRAAYFGHADMVTYLLDEGASMDLVDGEGDSPVHYACMKDLPNRNHAQVLQTLLDRGAKVNAQNVRGDTALHRAAKLGFNQRVTTLLQYHADPSVVNERDELPLHRACGNDDALVSVCMLLEGQLRTFIDAKSSNGATPLMYAVKSGSIEIVRFLLESDADVHARGPAEFTALHFAIQMKTESVRSELCKLLVEKGADVNKAAGEKGLTPFHYACANTLEDICLLFIRHKGDVLKKDSDGDSAWSLIPETCAELRSKLRPSPKPRSHGRSSSSRLNDGTPSPMSGSHHDLGRQTSSSSVGSLDMVTPTLQQGPPLPGDQPSSTGVLSNGRTGSSRSPQTRHVNAQSDQPSSAPPSLRMVSGSGESPRVEAAVGSTDTDLLPSSHNASGRPLPPAPSLWPAPVSSTGDMYNDRNGSIGVYEDGREGPPLEPSLLDRENERQASLGNAATIDISVSETVVTSPVSTEMLCISSKDLPKCSQLGSGAYSDVYKSEYRGEPVAVKLFKNLTMDEVIEVFDKEVKLLSQLSHPNVLRFVGYCTEPGFYAIVTDVMERGSLYDLLHDPDADLPWARRLSMMVGGAKGMEYLHSCSMLHRDLKSMNLLVKEDYTVKVADFGLTKVRMHTQTMASSLKGTPAYMAPELLDSKPISEATDVYAFGIILYEVATRKRPYYELTVNPIQLMMLVLRGQRPPFSPSADIPEGYVDLAKNCWHSDFTQRPSFTEVVGWLQVFAVC